MPNRNGTWESMSKPGYPHESNESLTRSDSLCPAPKTWASLCRRDACQKMEQQSMLAPAMPAKTRPRTIRTHSRRLSEIEMLVMRENVLCQEEGDLTEAAEKLSAQNLFRGHIDARLQEVNEQIDAIGELLTHQTPETVREMRLMLECLEQLAGTTNEQTLKSSLEKIERISEAVRKALPDVPFLNYEEHGFAMSRKTRAILDDVESAKSGPVAVDLAQKIAA